jgi:hypothetical protein
MVSAFQNLGMIFNYRRERSCNERQPLSQSQRLLKPMGEGKESE